MKHMFVIGILFTYVLGASAQNFKEDIKKMYAAYKNATAFYTEIKTEGFRKSTEDKPIFSKKAVLHKRGNSYLYKLDDMTTLINPKYQVATFGAKKMMVVQEAEEDVPALENMLVENLDSFLAQGIKVSYQGIVGGQKCYQVTHSEEGVVSKAEMYLDPATYLMTKLIYWTNSKALNQQSMVVSTFKGTTTKPTFDDATFSESQFFTKKQGKFVPAAAYKNFEIINTNDYDVQD